VSAARWLSVIPDSIPALLRKRNQWVVWRGDWNPAKKKYDKVIFQLNGRLASSTNPRNWSSFESAFAAYQSSRLQFHGVAYALAPDDGMVGIDIDHARNRTNGAMPRWVRDRVAHLDSYTEASPSGTGLRLFAFGKLPDGKGRVVGKLGRDRDIKLEIYQAHFLNITGHRLRSSPTTIKSRQRTINELMAAFFPQPEPAVPRPIGTQVLSITDQAVIDIASAASNGPQFRALYFYGNTAKYGGDHSNADLALLSHLAFYCGNTEQVERIFTESALGQRDKWRTRPDYRERSIAKAFAGRTEFYEPNHHINYLMRTKQLGSGGGRLRWNR
jgi:putative DNA primase/helicase